MSGNVHQIVLLVIFAQEMQGVPAAFRGGIHFDSAVQQKANYFD